MAIDYFQISSSFENDFLVSAKLFKSAINACLLNPASSEQLQLKRLQISLLNSRNIESYTSPDRLVSMLLALMIRVTLPSIHIPHG